ncbi:Gfo/Idh/MocA family oxidoreductase [archaeon]|jgi:predicted dehydrogenase|nr:Gfo/Idh/MocA family oxidoreductase [archaeon]
MKALFIGMGSIGQRHLRNFREILGSEAEVLVCRKTNHNLVIDNGQAFECESLKDYYGYAEISSLEQGLELFPDIVFVTNPSSKHIEVALSSAKAGANIFIEKPLSHNITGVKELQALADRNNLVVHVGYQTRYHPCFRDIQSVLNKARYGNLISASFEWGTYLPDHHPYEDYRDGYAANSNLGGGVTLGLIHEIDLIYSFFGIPKTIAAIGGKLSSLEMTADDTVSVLMGFERGEHVVPVNLFLSYAQKYETRTVRMQFEDALLVCDLMANSVFAYGAKGEILFQKKYGVLDRNEAFKAELVEFIGAVKRQDVSTNSLNSGAETLSIALRIIGEIDECIK